MQIREFLANFSVGAATGWDIFIVLIFLIAVFVYGFFLGRNRMIILLLSSYFSFSIMQVFPWSRLMSLSWLGIGEDPSASLKILIFVAVILLFYFLIPRSILSSTLRIRKRGNASWIQLFILSVVQIGLLAMVILSFLPVDNILNIGPVVKKVFVGPEAQFVWVILPILAITLMRRKRKAED